MELQLSVLDTSPFEEVPVGHNKCVDENVILYCTLRAARAKPLTEFCMETHSHGRNGAIF